MIGYMREWLERADRVAFNKEFPPYPQGLAPYAGGSARFLTEFVDQGAQRILVPDLRKTDILERKVIVSRKRTFNLFDTVNLWKRIVLEKLDERESSADAIRPLTEPHILPGEERANAPSTPEHLGLEDMDISPYRRSPSPILADGVSLDDMVGHYLRIGRA